MTERMSEQYSRSKKMRMDDVRLNRSDKSPNFFCDLPNIPRSTNWKVKITKMQDRSTFIPFAQMWLAHRWQSQMNLDTGINKVPNLSSGKISSNRGFNDVQNSHNPRINLAGMPTTLVPRKTFFVTTAPAPTVASSSTTRFCKICAPVPTSTRLPI